MPSSAIRYANYNGESMELRVTFVSGRVYVYSGVPQTVYDAFCNALSRGSFFNRAIRGRYDFREVIQDRKRSAR